MGVSSGISSKEWVLYGLLSVLPGSWRKAFEPGVAPDRPTSTCWACGCPSVNLRRAEARFRFLPDGIRLLTAPMPLPATGSQGNGPNRLPVLQPRLGSGTLLLCPPLEPVPPETHRDRPRLNEAGTLAGRPSYIASGETIRDRSDPLAHAPTHLRTEARRSGVTVTRRKFPPRRSSPALSRDVRLLSALQLKQGIL